MERIRMKDLLKTASEVNVPEVASDDFLEDYQKEDTSSVISVDYVDVPEIIVQEIKDVNGRLSDIIESLEQTLSLSVIPLEMANIAPEVTKLQRHEIFSLQGRRFAMSKVPRERVVQAYCDRIVDVFSRGLPFIENLSTLVNYRGKDYKTLSLSQAEWTLIISKFRSYNYSLAVNKENDLVLEIYPERVIT